jgi:hypothetical protein
VPSSTISTRSSSNNTQTRIHARELRVLLESLDDVFRTRSQLVERAQHRAEADDIQPRIMKVASGFERWAEVQPVMFADVSDEELAKYDKFIQGIAEGEQKQNGILQDIQVCEFLGGTSWYSNGSNSLAMSCFYNPERTTPQSKNANTPCSLSIFLTTSIGRSVGI